MSARNFDRNARKGRERFTFEQDNENESWFANGLHRFIIVFSVMWFGIVAVYITKFLGWDTLFSLMPNEFSGFMAGITLPLAIVWVIMAYIDRGSSFRKETQMLRDSLNQVIFPDSNGSEATKMIAEAIKSQVADLKEVTRDVCAQSDVIKRDLTERVTEMKELADALDKYSSHTMLELNEEIQKLIENFTAVTEKATATTSDFRVNTLQMKDDSEKIVSLLTPMVNEMVTAAERVKEVVNVNNENIEKAQEQLNQYSESSRLAIGRIIESWAEKGEKLEKTFLRTAENCEEMFRRLDSGISQIENSINEQKQVVETQSGMIDKNSSYLDERLGKYGRLISLEVEAMVERSNTLEQNIRKQIQSIRDTTAEVQNAFNSLGTDISEKRALLQTEGSQIVDNINLTVDSLDKEIERLAEFYNNTRDKNSEFHSVFETVATNLQNIGDNLDKNVNELSSKTQSVFERFSEVNQQIAGNISRLEESTDKVTKQSQLSAQAMVEQDDYINQTLANLTKISKNITTLNKDLSATGNEVSTTLDNYAAKMGKFGGQLKEHLSDLRSDFEQTAKKIDHFDKKMKSVKIDTFMKNSEDIVTELESISIDISSIFSKSGKDDDLWKKYYEGDRSIFVRYLAKSMTKKEIVAIREDYEKKTDFRIIVDKYLDDFDTLISTARENEHANTLLAMISGSDIGKVYYILSKALGKVK